MPLTSGSRLGSYELTSSVAVGGMGEVYRARDTRLNRTVAIKVIAHADAGRPESQARFEREAKALSTLSHPNICTLYDYGYADGQQFLVMEFLDGETLADRLRRGRMRVQDVLHYAIKVAEALSHAHRHGLIHRDLKPTNIMLTSSGIKVLDFGLARTVRGSDGEQTKTLSDTLTNEGSVLGTFPYMSPEQLQGRDVDARSDIFAFGAVLHEMLTGQAAFAAESAASTIAAVLERDPPPVSRLHSDLPASLDWIVQTCLQKNREDRWQAAHDVKLELERVCDVQSHTSPSPAWHSRQRGAWIAAAAAVTLSCCLVAAIVSSQWTRSEKNSPAFRFQVPPPPGTSFAASLNTSVPVIGLSICPDGSKIAFVAEAAGTQMIWVRNMAEPVPHLLAGTEGGQQPFWSPDGRSIGFFAHNSLRKIDATGRSPAVTLAEASADPRGGAWLTSGMIVYAPSNREGLLMISANGGQPTSLFGGKGQRWWPSPLPDGKGFIFYDRAGGGLFVGSTEGTSSERILATNWAGVYMDPGYLLYLRDGVLMSQKFDTRHAKLYGDATPIGEHAGAGTTAVPGFSASNAGILIHSGILMDVTRMVIYDRQGAITSALTEPGQYMDPRISSDGRKIAWSRLDPAWLAQDIWLYDSDRGTTTRVTSEPFIEASPVWSRDATRLLYRSNRTGLINLYIRDLTTGIDHAVFDHARQWQAHRGTQNACPNDWSGDGQYLIYTVPGRTGYDLFRVTLEPDAMPQALTTSEFNEMHASLSPDGQTLAFASDESGQLQVYVQSFPEGKRRTLVSIRGGAEPHWRADGRELYFLDPAGKLMVVRVSPEGAIGKPEELFPVRTPVPMPYRQDYYPAPDGQHFIVNAMTDNQPAATITVVVNWPALTKEIRSDQ